MNRIRAVLLAFVLALSVAAGGTGAAQEDLVTLTVSVETSAGDPVRSATLTASWGGGSTSATTVSDGRALMDVPEDVDVELTVEHDDYVRNFPATVEDASAREVSVTVYPKSSLRLTISDASGTVEDADVVMRKNRRDVVEGTTDAAGVVDSGVIESGDYTVVVSKTGYFVTEEEVDVSGDTAVELSIERGTVTLEVNVTDDHFDPAQPVGQATVDVRGSGSVVTQPAGIGRISVPVNAWANLEITKEGYLTSETATFVSEEDTRVDASIQRTPAISIDLLNRRVVIGESVALSVTDEYDDPVAGATVLVDGEAVAETDESGQAVVQIDGAGNHTVVAEAGSLEAEPKTVIGVAEGGATDPATDTGDSDEPEPAATGEETEAELPGFGVVVALLALTITALGMARRSGRK